MSGQTLRIVLASLMVLGLAAAAAGGVGDFRGHGVVVARIELEKTVLERGDKLKGQVLLPKWLASVPGSVPSFRLQVCDSLGRLLVDRRSLLKDARHETALASAFELEVPGVKAMKHTLTIIVSGPVTFAASADFIYTPPKKWDDYICTIWQRHNPKRLPYLQEMHLSGSQWTGSSSHVPEHFINRNYRYYLETGGAWAFSAYHMWMPDKEKTFYHKLAKKAFIADRTNMRILERNPCLSNHVIQRRLKWIFTHQARLHRPYRPLFYTIGDEPGIANQAAPFDYCFSPHCKAAFREWLKKRYTTLAALNKQWGSDFKKWEDVRGATTDEIFARKDDNFSAWCDHKDFMDDVLIGGYAEAGKTTKRYDPAGRLGMGGAQGPAAVGGWDFWKLCQAFDVLEAYYIGNNYELMRSFKPELIPVHASFGRGNPEKHLIWYLFIHGDRGLLVWDDKSKYVTDAGKYSPRAKEAKKWYAELTGGIGMLRMASQRTDDPIALYHSQANLRTHWVLEVRPAGKAWINRDSRTERMNNRNFRLRESWVKLIEDNGLQFKFLCPPQVAKGDLKFLDKKTGAGFKVLLLPEVLAMSDAEVKAVRAFVKAGGTVIADRLPATFDEHGKKRKASPLAKLFKDEKRAILLDKDMLPYYHHRLYPKGHTKADDSLKELIGGHLAAAVGKDRVTPVVVGPDGKPVTGVEVTVWRNGKAELIALHRNPQLRVDELGPQKYKSNKKFEVPVKLTLKRPKDTEWFIVRGRGVKWPRAIPVGKECSITLDPFEPAMLMAFPLYARAVDATVKVKVADGRIQMSPAGLGKLMARPVYHLDFIGPDGKERLVYRRNFTCKPAGGSLALPLALNDATGKWKLKVRNVATGQTIIVPFEVKR